MIELFPMQASDFQAYLDETIPAYADDKVKAGNWSVEEALERSRQEFEKYLPEGLNTEGQFLYNIVETEAGRTVGSCGLPQ